jgi:hypothetical protein
MATYSEANAVPGTVHLIDLEHTLHTRHAGSGTGDIVLVPTPSNDPDDPLNWTPRRKLTATICSSLSVSMPITKISLTHNQIYMDDWSSCFDSLFGTSTSIGEFGRLSIDTQ